MRRSERKPRRWVVFGDDELVFNGVEKAFGDDDDREWLACSWRHQSSAICRGRIFLALRHWLAVRAGACSIWTHRTWQKTPNVPRTSSRLYKMLTPFLVLSAFHLSVPPLPEFPT